MTNASLRARFLLDNSNSSSQKISRLINKALEKRLIKNGPNKTYIPFWGKSSVAENHLRYKVVKKASINGEKVQPLKIIFIRFVLE